MTSWACLGGSGLKFIFHWKALGQIIDKQTNIGINLFEEVFGYDTPDKILQTLRSLKRVDSYNQEAFLIEDSVVRFGIELKGCQKVLRKTKERKYWRLLARFLTLI